MIGSYHKLMKRTECAGFPGFDFHGNDMLSEGNDKVDFSVLIVFFLLSKMRASVMFSYLMQAIPARQYVPQEVLYKMNADFPF